MIPLILLHIALAQVGQPCIVKDNFFGSQSEMEAWLDIKCPNRAKPPEHTIEIRTKRETDGWSGYPIACAAGDDFEWQETPGPTGLWFRCIRIVKTLYIDGQRIGVIRETEEK